MKLSIKADRRLPLLLHILAWMIILILPRYLVNTYGDGDMRLLGHYYLNVSFYGLFFYVNYLVLVPRFYFREKRLLYFGLLLLLILVLSVLRMYLNEAILSELFGDGRIERMIERGGEMEGPGPRGGPGGPGGPPPFRMMGVVSTLATLILLTGFSLGLGVLDRLRHNEKEKKEMEKEMLNTELALLKNQISPHFFFNTLNNIYSLIKFDTEKAGETVHKLSKLMRYLLYDSDKNLTSLKDEIQFMRNYIELMQLRLNEKVTLSVDLPEDPPALNVPPLLFIPVVENAFKHGVSYRDPSFIEIGMEIREKELVFRTRNSLVEHASEEPGEHTGIGMENVRKRLNLLFPGKHTCTMGPGKDDFQVEIAVNTEALQP